MKFISCQICERTFKSIKEVKKHVADKSIIVRDGKCLKGNSCDYSYVGFGRLTVSEKLSKQCTLSKIDYVKYSHTWYENKVCFNAGVVFFLDLWV